MEFVGCSWKLSVVQMLYNSVEVTNEYSPIVRSIKELMHRSWRITINHIYIYREANFAADYLLNYSSDVFIGFHNFISPLASVTSLLLHDIYETAYPRLVLP